MFYEAGRQTVITTAMCPSSQHIRNLLLTLLPNTCASLATPLHTICSLFSGTDAPSQPLSNCWLPGLGWLLGAFAVLRDEALVLVRIYTHLASPQIAYRGTVRDQRIYDIRAAVRCNVAIPMSSAYGQKHAYTLDTSDTAAHQSPIVCPHSRLRPNAITFPAYLWPPT